MLADYTIGFFAIRAQEYDKLNPIFQRAAKAIDSFDDDFSDYANTAYEMAREASLNYVELNEEEDVEPYTAFGEVVDMALGDAVPDSDLYAPDEAEDYYRWIWDVHLRASKN